MSDNSLVPKNMYGDGVKVLEFHRDRCVVDLNYFFKDLFAKRDEVYGESQYPRWKEEGDVTTYHFKFIELCETFLSSYSSSKFAKFLENHLDIEDSELQSESLLVRIKNFEKDNRIAFTRRWDYSEKCVYPFNFPAEDLSKAMFFGKFKKIKEYFTSVSFEDGFPFITNDRLYLGSGVNYKVKYSLQQLRENLMNVENPIIFLVRLHWFNDQVNLDLFDIISHYNIPRDDLYIVREE